MSVTNAILAIPFVSLDVSTVTSSLTPINTSGLPEACFLIRLVNDSNRDLQISYDGSTPHDFMKEESIIQLPLQTSPQPGGIVPVLRKGTVVYVSHELSPGVGNIYLIGYYQVPR